MVQTLQAGTRGCQALYTHPLPAGIKGCWKLYRPLSPTDQAPIPLDFQSLQGSEGHSEVSDSNNNLPTMSKAGILPALCPFPELNSSSG